MIDLNTLQHNGDPQNTTGSLLVFFLILQWHTDSCGCQFTENIFWCKTLVTSSVLFPGVTGCFGSYNRHPRPGDPTEADQTPAHVQVAFYCPHCSPLFNQSHLEAFSAFSFSSINLLFFFYLRCISVKITFEYFFYLTHITPLIPQQNPWF